MAKTKITALTELTDTNIAIGDLIPIVDISDTSQAASGTTKKVTITSLATAVASAFSGDSPTFVNLNTTGTTTLGDASGDAVTINAATITLANDTNFVLSGGVNGVSFGTDVLSIDATNSRVGIGTVIPSAKLEIKDSGYSTGLYVNTANIYGADIRLNNTGTGGEDWHITSTGSGNSPGAGSLQFYNDTDAAARLVLYKDGKVGIGQTNPASSLDIKSADATSGTSAITIANSAGTELFFIRSDGALRTGSATASPYNNTIASSANVWINTDGTLLRATSSLKYKREVQDATFGLSDVMNLRAVTYKGKNEVEGERVYGGLIAEEVDAIGLTQFVEYAKDGTPDALHYGNMVSLCVKAIQELSAKVTALENK